MPEAVPPARGGASTGRELSVLVPVMHVGDVRVPVPQ
jgi:hypothetical protein